ncbi:geranylgeranyl reductase family protein [Chloroflexota bacterium]
MHDVIVVGAGPVGSHISYRLAKLGHSVLVIEEHQQIGEPVQCSGIIGRECVDLYQIPKSAVLTKSQSAKFFSPSGKYIRLAKEQVQAYIVDRRAMDVEFADRARSAGAEYRLTTKVDDVRIYCDGVHVKAINGSDAELYKAKVIVIASGFGSRLPYKLGLGRVADYIAGAQMEVETSGVDEVEVYFSQNTALGFFGWLIPTGGNKGLAGLFSRITPRRYLSNFIKDLKAEGKITAEGKVVSGGIPLKTLPRTYTDKVLVVGDAAGQVKPTTGGGVYYGLICADIATDVLHKALSVSDCSENMLSLYEKGWKKRLGRDLKIGYLARWFYEKLSDHQIETMFRLLESKGIAGAMLNSDQMRFDWHSGLLLKGLQYIGPWRYFFSWNKDKSKARV